MFTFRGARQHAAGIDNRAALLGRDPMSDHFLADVESSGRVDVHHGLPALRSAFVQGAIAQRTPADASHIKHSVNAAEFLYARRHRFLYPSVIGHIRHRVSRIRNVFAQIPTFAFAVSDDKNSAASARRQPGRSRSDSGRSGD